LFILPINRDARPNCTPWVTYGLIGVNSILWIVLAIIGRNSEMIATYGFRPAEPSFLTLFASMFLHVGILHVAGNMWFLWMFAPKIEARLGSSFFLLAYLMCGVGGTGLHMLFSLGSSIPCVGASGAISGVAGMYFLLFPRSPFDLALYFGWWRITTFHALTRVAVGTWIGEQFVLGLLSQAFNGGRGSGVAFWAHVGGFAIGLLCAALVLPKASMEEREAILRPTPLSEDERDEIFADRVEQPSELTSLKLND
jgi:membrane associated rhomboid family serine protease